VLQCVWSFLSDPTNQATLKWVFGGVAAALGSLWGAFQFLYATRNGRKVKTHSRALWWVTVTSIVIIFVPLGTIGYWIWTEAASYCPDCYGRTRITIKSPLDHSLVSTSDSVYAFANGTATASRVCRYVYIFVKDLQSETLKATDLTQTSDDGEWFARLDFRHVQEGGWAGVIAVLLDRPLYPVNTTLSSPPVHGRPSQTLQLRRQP
jgi:hypothetical protein